jgi:hypothetical protein
METTNYDNDNDNDDNDDNDHHAAAASQRLAWAFISPEWQTVIAGWRSKREKCAWCGFTFYESDNIGRWQCRQHRQVQYSTAYSMWQCCGFAIANPKNTLRYHHTEMAPELSGCVLSDHSAQRERVWNMYDAVPLPRILQALIEPRDDACISDREEARRFVGEQHPLPDGTMFVARYDWRNAVEYSQLLYPKRSPPLPR